jgi:glycosyltransferase involved in cell wall biosynthesis
LLWYPKEHFRLRVAPEYIFEGTNRMRIWDFHAAYRQRPGFTSHIAEYTARDPNPFDYDVVIFSKGGPSPFLTRWLREAGVLVVWDQCDPIRQLPPGLAESVDLITTNSDELKAELEALGGGLPVAVAYDPHEADLSNPRQHRAAATLRVTWFGWGHNYLSFVKPLVPLLRSLEFVDFAWAGADRPENRAEFGFTPGIQMGLDPREAWRRADSWLSFVRDSDVGLVPVAGQTKPSHKILNYMAYGVPVICSPTDAHRRLVRHGENSLLAESESDWAEGLARLRDACERQRLGDQARRDVGQSRSPEALVETHFQMLRTHMQAREPATQARRLRRSTGRAWYPLYRRYQRWREAGYLREAGWPM